MGQIQGFPIYNQPLVDPDRTITQPWRQLLVSLWNRTGGATSSTANHITDPGPDWPTYNSIYDVFTVNVNGYPVTSEFGDDAVGIAQAIVGLMNVPASSAAGNAAMAVSGYGRTAGPGQGVVGVFGAGLASGDGASVWGLNALVSNGGQPQPAANTGHENVTMYGMEIDLNIKKRPGAVVPNYAARGIYIIGDSDTAPAGGLASVLNAIEIDSYGISQSPKLKWNSAFFTVDGAATYGLNLGCTGTGNSVGSQPIVMNARTAGGVAKAASITTDLNGNIVYTADAARGHTFASVGSTDATLNTAGLTVTGLTTSAGFYTNDGGAVYSLNIGATGVGSSVGSQPIVMRARNAGGVAKQASITTDLDGGIIYTANAGAGHAFASGGATDVVIDAAGLLTAAAVTVTGTLTAGSFAPASISTGNITTSTGNLTSTTVMTYTAAAGQSHDFKDGGTTDAQVLPGGIFRYGSVVQCGLSQTLHQRHTGWSEPTGSSNLGAWDTSTITLPDLAAAVRSLILALHYEAGGHGLIGN